MSPPPILSTSFCVCKFIMYIYIYIYICPHVVHDYLARAGHGRDAIGVLVEAIASCGLIAFLYCYGHGRSQRQPAVLCLPSLLSLSLYRRDRSTAADSLLIALIAAVLRLLSLSLALSLSLFSLSLILSWLWPQAETAY